MHPVLQTLLRALAAGAIVVGVAEIAGRWQRLGALILLLPIAIPVVFLTMYMKTGELAPISGLSRQALLLIPLGLPFFLPLAFAHRLQLSFWPALAAGLALFTLTVSLYLWLVPENL